MVGLNTFYDRDIENEHQRGSLGAELRTAVIETNYNYYFKIQEDGTESENVLEGYDFQLSSQIPYLHWAKVFVNTHEWYGQTRDDVTGKKIGSDAALTPHLNLEFAYDNKKATGVTDQWYAKLQFIHPPKEGPTAADGVSSNIWKENSDMRIYKLKLEK